MFGVVSQQLVQADCSVFA